MSRKLKGKIGYKKLRTTLLNHISKKQALKKRKQKIAHKTKPVINSKVKKNQQKQKEHETKFIPISKNETLLLVGEGNFSFARSLIEQDYILPENLIVTSYDASVQELKLKYPHTFEENYKFLVEEKVLIFFHIDCTNLIKSFKISKKNTWKKIMQTKGNISISGKVIQNIMFNFPHNGKGIKDMDKNIRDHQELISAYFKNCKDFFKMINSTITDAKTKYTQGYSLDERKNDGRLVDGVSESGIGKVILTMFTGEPYDLWEVRALAKQTGFQVEKSNKFQWENYPEYHHKRTNSEQDTTKPAQEREARTYVFKIFENSKKNKRSQKNNDDDDKDMD
ncbi:hypothetical protein TPHA_0C03340 [Tetrapisispora phaffii CBS 4417]|uniref:25S rRNA (uridine-N(3))-methyltransferase BMT5-like domain-containing protein n=1 Tax=Tetrapisispora phaffii (strain ATCC 24235 / CBS 4417 / NBRC 1672 / NRRL Y-8282 / UCD 70-5) TaxID=1071381 RepID=G8BRW0_TETPH|nr:hypothetical protein TPHA_0C03340 [Tetrapisispora phaffii CBS 4417]CCE62486.1 hypothetical protein TPHA_0C03340 [Tetrapisispora phaffii CBS 4417]